MNRRPIADKNVSLDINPNWGDKMAEGLKTAIEESRVFNLPNSAIKLVTNNSIANPIFNSSGNLMTGPFAQIGGHREV